MSEANKIGRGIAITSLLVLVGAALVQNLALCLGAGVMFGVGCVLWIIGEDIS